MFGKKSINQQTCERCPHRRDPAGCPCWISEKAGFMETNIVSGEERFIVGCFYQVIPRLMVELVKASNRPAAAIESTRNEIVKGFATLAAVSAANGSLIAAQPQPVQLEDRRPS